MGPAARSSPAPSTCAPSRQSDPTSSSARARRARPSSSVRPSRTRLYDLLDSSAYLALSREPARLAQELAPAARIVAIDGIQRLPELLDEVHRLIEARAVRFLLTGSSARKLRRGKRRRGRGGALRVRGSPELIFLVEEAPEGGFTARALGESIFTEADGMADLHDKVRDAVRCHFDEGQLPRILRLHFVREEVITA